MENASILIVEDNLIVAEDMKEILSELGYQITGISRTYEQAIESISTKDPNLILIDINLASDKDGIELAEYLHSSSGVPFLFVTASADEHHMRRAKRAHPWGYVLKPFSKDDLFAAIEIALFNFQYRGNTLRPKKLTLTTKAGDIELERERIKYFKGAGNYVDIHLLDKKMSIRTTLASLLNQLPDENFMQIHKSYIVNRNMIQHISSDKVVVGNEKLPMGRSFRIKMNK